MNNGYANGQNVQSSEIANEDSTQANQIKSNKKSSDIKRGSGNWSSDHAIDKLQDGKCGSVSCGASSDNNSDMKLSAGSCGSDDESSNNSDNANE